jgi:hypothetical protein
VCSEDTVALGKVKGSEFDERERLHTQRGTQSGEFVREDNE